MRNRSPANSAASSPPVPARTSRMAEAFSSASRGASSRATSRSRSGSLASRAAMSSRAISARSGSSPAIMRSRSSRSARAPARRVANSATGRSSACSLPSRTISAPSLAVSIRASTSRKRSSTCSRRAWGRRNGLISREKGGGSYISVRPASRARRLNGFQRQVAKTPSQIGLTIRRIPSLIKGVLKLIKRPSLKPESLRYVRTCEL